MDRLSFLKFIAMGIPLSMLCRFDILALADVSCVKMAYALPGSEYPGKLKPLRDLVGGESKWKG